MRGETQAVHLSKIMQSHKLYPEYELVFPFVKIKKKSVKKMTKNDIVLLGLETFNMCLLSEKNMCANVSLVKEQNSRKLKIISLENMNYASKSQKYEILKCSLGMIQSRKIEIGHKIDISSLHLDEVLLSVEEKTIAKGFLVTIDNEIAIQIREVV